MNTRIQWNYPAPRRGWRGALDRFFGPGATKAEILVQCAFSGAAGVALFLYVLLAGLAWTPVQTALAILLAADMVGGMVTNATSSAKRWYHRDGQGFRQHFGFTAAHAAHVFLVAWLFRAMDWAFFGGVSAGLLGAAILILKTPLYLRRPVAMGLFAFCLVLQQVAFPATPGLEWFVPFLFLKLLVSHLLREEPYRPPAETRT